jgi:hypothetical protein
LGLIATCNGDATRVIVVDLFLHIVLQLQKFFFVHSKVQDQTIRLITLLTTDFMAHGTKILG